MQRPLERNSNTPDSISHVSVTSAPCSAQPSPTHEIDGLSTVSPSEWATTSNGEHE